MQLFYCLIVMLFFGELLDIFGWESWELCENFHPIFIKSLMYFPVIPKAPATPSDAQNSNLSII
jgi:hypothetical protein